jgi:predicted pyridoxine 5'-phosphate oxidase superfamily flavin-nucleotide-binding protein
MKYTLQQATIASFLTVFNILFAVSQYNLGGWLSSPPRFEFDLTAVRATFVADKVASEWLFSKYLELPG